ncbi:MAG TPA: hypothetical protein VHY35_06790 [Stellaceae bacterium]|jgi:hypothetical protein|nr:hypothetical protein [Stellaceae bacterium]
MGVFDGLLSLFRGSSKPPSPPPDPVPPQLDPALPQPDPLPPAMTDTPGSWQDSPPPAIPQSQNVSAATVADPVAQSPAWLTRDIQRKAKWLPTNIKNQGLSAAFQQRWEALPPDLQGALVQMSIPSWMIALVPMDADKQDEIQKQFRFMVTLAGAPPGNRIAARAEQILIFAGSAQLPTPGDNQTGASLGAEGCTAAISKYVLAQLKREFPQELAGMSDALTTCQSSAQMRPLFEQAANASVVEIVSRPFAQLQPGDFLPGSITIGQKPGGTHVFAWTRIPAGWQWAANDLMAVGNTGLPQFGDRMILAQEYVTENPELPGELEHNQHGPINSSNVIYKNGQPDLSDPRTNVYAAKGSNFVLVRLLDRQAATA